MIIKGADDYGRRGASDAALPDAAAGEKWLPMRRIFALADHIELSRS